MNQQLSVLVIGGLNTDIIARGIRKILKAGENTFAEELIIGPGGKSRNIAHIIATLLGKNRVAMMGKTSKDPYGLWKPPVTALKKSGVNTQCVKIVSFKNSNEDSDPSPEPSQ